MSSLFFFGPASGAQWGPNASLRGASRFVTTCTGGAPDVPPFCADIAASITDASGRKLPTLLTKNGIDPKNPGELYFGAFSAGGHLLKRVCLNADDRALMTGMVLSDATYTTDLVNGAAAPIEGFVLYALDALMGTKIFVATASSSPNKTYPTGAQALDAIRLEVEKRAGRKFQQGGYLAGVPVQPVKLWTLNNVVFADYQQLVPHAGHATLIAPGIWQNVVQPWADVQKGGLVPSGPEPVTVDGSPWWQDALAVTAGAAAGWYVGSRLGRRR